MGARVTWLTLWLLLICGPALAQRTPRVVDDLNALVALPPSRNQPDVIVTGGHGGLFRWVSDSVLGTNGANIISVPFGASYGRYHRQQGVAITVDSVPDLVALVPQMGFVAQTRGYHTPGDGGHGLYRWTNSLPDGVSTNRGTWFAGATGFWGLVHDGTVNVRQFGARGDGVTDDYPALQAAAINAIDPHGAATIEYPAGVYAFATPADFKIYGPSTHRGDGGAWIKLLVASSTGQIVKLVDISSGSTIEGINVESPGIIGQNGFGMADNVTDITIRNCRAENLSHGTFPGSIGGGRGFTAQHAAGGGARRILIDGCTVRNAFQAFDVSGRLDVGGSETFEQPGEGVRVVNSYAENCQILIGCHSRNHAGFPPEGNVLSAVFSNIQGNNVGWNTSYPTNRFLEVASWDGTNITTTTAHFLVWGDPVVFDSSFGNVVGGTTYYVRNTTANNVFSIVESNSPGSEAFDVGTADAGSIPFTVRLYYNAPIRLDRAANVILDNIQINNDRTNYPKMDAVILGKGTRIVADVTFRGRTRNVIDGRTWSETTIWNTHSTGLTDSVLNVQCYETADCAIVAEYGANKLTRNVINIGLTDVVWGLVNVNASLQAANTISVRQFAGKIRAGSAAFIYANWNDFSQEVVLADGISQLRMGYFDVATTQTTNVAIGSLYHGGHVFIRRNGINQIELTDGRIRFPNSSWNGGRLWQYGDQRFWVDDQRLRSKVGSDPTSVSDGRAVGYRRFVNIRTGSTTFNVLTHAEVQIFTISADQTVTLSTSDALRGDHASIVRPGTEAYTLNVGPGLKTIPSGVAATVDVIFDGTNWVLWRYSTH